MKAKVTLCLLKFHFNVSGVSRPDSATSRVSRLHILHHQHLLPWPRTADTFWHQEYHFLCEYWWKVCRCCTLTGKVFYLCLRFEVHKHLLKWPIVKCQVFNVHKAKDQIWILNTIQFEIVWQQKKTFVCFKLIFSK